MGVDRFRAQKKIPGLEEALDKLTPYDLINIQLQKGDYGREDFYTNKDVHAAVYANECRLLQEAVRNITTLPQQAIEQLLKLIEQGWTIVREQAAAALLSMGDLGETALNLYFGLPPIIDASLQDSDRMDFDNVTGISTIRGTPKQWAIPGNFSNYRNTPGEADHHPEHFDTLVLDGKYTPPFIDPSSLEPRP